MKSRLFMVFCIGITIVSCQKDNAVVTPLPATQSASSATRHHTRRLSLPSDTLGSRFIPMSIANAMISSYLSSINSAQNDTDIKSFSVNADSLRAYLSDPSIKNVKLVFAHTMAYVTSGNSGTPAGYQSGAMTIIMAGYDSVGNYVYKNGNVLDHLVPCPYTCPPGNAGNDLLQ